MGSNENATAAVILKGNPASGFEVVGPYPDIEAAVEAGDTVDSEWWAMPLTPPDAEAADGTRLLEVTESEFDTIIAALRYWQRMEMYNPDIGSRRAPDEFNIATDNSGDPINSEGIDNLIERLNA